MLPGVGGRSNACLHAAVAGLLHGVLQAERCGRSGEKSLQWCAASGTGGSRVDWGQRWLGVSVLIFQHAAVYFWLRLQRISDGQNVTLQTAQASARKPEQKPRLSDKGRLI